MTTDQTHSESTTVDTRPVLTPHGDGSGLEAAASAARRVVQALMLAGEHADVDSVTARLEALADELESVAPALEDRLVEMWTPARPLNDAVTGTENPSAPPLVVRGDEDGWVEGQVVLGLPQQGQPRISHGGWSALVVDHTMGVANNYAKNSGMTARLVLNYRKPVPLFTPLTVRAKQVAAEGRKIWTEATLCAGDTVCIEAEALFIQGHMPRPDGSAARRDS